MMKPIDDEKRGLKLESLKELLKEMKSGSLAKLPKGKGVSMMSVSVSKPKDLEAEDETSEEMSDESEEMMSADRPEMEEESDDVSEEAAEMMPKEEEDEDEYKFPEPKIPSDILELVKLMMKSKKEAE